MHLQQRTCDTAALVTDSAAARQGPQAWGDAVITVPFHHPFFAVSVPANLPTVGASTMSDSLTTAGLDLSLIGLDLS
jgi:hypothetical protein